MRTETLDEPPRDGPRSEEFDLFYAATARRVVSVMAAITGNLPEAQDCTQEAFERAWSRWNTVRDHADPEAWVRLTARRIAVSRWRRARAGIRAMTRHGASPDVPQPNLDRVALLAALRELPEKQRTAIVLHHLVGLSVEDVAREVGAPVGTVKARLSRGRAALAPLVGEPETGPHSTAWQAVTTIAGGTS